MIFSNGDFSRLVNKMRSHLAAEIAATADKEIYVTKY